MPTTSLGLLCAYTGEALERAAVAEPLDALDRSDREAELLDWLDAHGIPDAADLVPALAEAQLDEAWIERFIVEVAPPDEKAALVWIVSRVAASRLSRGLEESTSRISHLVQAVKAYSYLDQAPRQQVDLHEGLESTLAMLGHKLQQGSIEIVREYDRSLPRVEVYASELNQVWTNLIDNALDAVSGGGRITLRTYQAGDRAVVEVEDDGAGVPAEVRGRIFDPFFTTKPQGQGTGLGLDIAQRIVLRHHGELRLLPGAKGARFRVSLPFRQ
jgi:signal transduction histidine kinase